MQLDQKKKKKEIRFQNLFRNVDTSILANLNP